jgi:hypothetical protein
MAKIIGFTNVFYTLWDVSEPYQYYFDEHNFEYRVDCVYIKNLSKDFEVAKSTMGDSEYEVDLKLRGCSSFWKSVGKKKNCNLSPTLFPTGKLVGEEITTCTDEKALWFMYLKKSIWNNEVKEHSFKELNPHWVKPCVYARRRLIELGLLERYKGNYYSPDMCAKIRFKDELQSGLFFKDKEKVTLEVKLIDTFGFDGAYGYTSIYTFGTKCGKIVKYMGVFPPHNETWRNEFVPIKCTIKNSEYKGVPETRIQRVEVLDGKNLKEITIY